MPRFPLGILNQQLLTSSFSATIAQTLSMITQSATATFAVASTYSGTITQTLPMLTQYLTDVTRWDPIGDIFSCSVSPPTAVSPTGQTFSC